MDDENNTPIEGENPPIDDEETPSVDVMNSILNSVKKNLGIESSYHDFDQDIIMNINSAIFTLTQFGIGPDNGYIVQDEKDTYFDYLGTAEPFYQAIKMYLTFRTRLGFDPPTSSYVLESIKDQIKELEWRLLVMTEQLNNYWRKEGGEISK